MDDPIADPVQGPELEADGPDHEPYIYHNPAVPEPEATPIPAPDPNRAAVEEQALAQLQAQAAKKVKGPPSWYHAVVIVLAVIILAFVVLIVQKFIFGTSPTATPSSVTVPITAPNKTSNSSCPCLSEQQIQKILNESPALMASAVFNSSFKPTLASLKSASSEINTSLSMLPANLTSGITGGWLLSYNSSNDKFAEQVLESGSSTGPFCSFYSKGLGPSPSAHVNNTVNGMDYLYLNGSMGPYTTITLIGCKDKYVVTMTMLTENNGSASPSSIAAQISATT